jgi:hypothetical protein
MAAIVSPATGDTATAAWADSVADQVNTAHTFMTLANPNATSTGAGTATWVTMGNVTVPTWATKARISLAMTGLQATATTTSANLAVKIGSSTGAVHLIATPNLTGTRIHAGFNDLLTSVPTGSQSVTVQATFSASTWIAPATSCSFDLNIDWLA